MARECFWFDFAELIAILLMTFLPLDIVWWQWVVIQLLEPDARAEGCRSIPKVGFLGRGVGNPWFSFYSSYDTIKGSVIHCQ